MSNASGTALLAALLLLLVLMLDSPCESDKRAIEKFEECLALEDCSYTQHELSEYRTTKRRYQNRCEE